MPDLSADRPLLLPEKLIEWRAALPAPEPRFQVKYFNGSMRERYARFFDVEEEAREFFAVCAALPEISEVEVWVKVSTPWVEVDRSTEA